MRRAAKWMLGIALVLAIAVVGAVFTLTNTDWGREKVRARIVAMLDESVHGNFRVGRISGNMLKGLTLHDLAITDSANAPFVSAKSIRAGYGLRALISKKIELSDVDLVEPVIVLERGQDDVWNYDRIFAGDSGSAPKDTAGLQFGDWLVFSDVRIARGQLYVRTPWRPDSGLSAAARDSAVRAALSKDSRTMVVQVPGGYQQRQEFRDITGVLPLLRIAHPDHRSRRIEVDSLRTVALAFAPPAADVRQLRGVFEIDTDSLWFRDVDVTLPASRANVTGRYVLESGDLALGVQGQQVAFDDVRFLYPALPDEGQARFALVMSMADSGARYSVRDLDLQTGAARASGTVDITVADTLRLHGTDVTFSGIDTRLIERLVPAIDVPRQGVLSGRAKVDGTLASMDVDGDVTFNDRRSGRSRVIAAGEIGAVDGVVRANGLRVTLSPVQVDLARIAMSDFPLSGTLTGRATVNGSTNTLLVARNMDLTHLDRGARSRVVGRGAVRLGDVPYLDIDVMARPLSLVTVGRFAPAAELRGAVTGPVALKGTLRDLAINSTLRSPDGGTISATGRMDLKSPELGYNMNVATVLWNANAISGKAPVTSLSAQAEARGRGTDPATMRADFALRADLSRYDTIAVDSLQTRVRIANALATIDTLTARAPGIAVDALGTFGLSKTSRGSLRYAVAVDSLQKLSRYIPGDTGLVFPRPARTAEQLARLRADSAREEQRLMVARAAGAAPPGRRVVIDTPAGVPRDSLAGAVRIAGTLTGGLGGFDTQGEGTGTGLLVQGNSAQQLRLRYDAKGILTDAAAYTARVNADSISAAGFLLDSVASEVSYRKPGGTAQVAIFQNTERDYNVRADYALYTDRKELLFNQLRMRFDTTVWVSPHPGAVRWGQPGIEIDSIELRNGTAGRVFADGRLPTEGPANLRLEVANFQVGDLMGLLQSDVPARGLLTINTSLTGTGRAPVIRGDAAVADAMYKGTVVPDVRTTFNYADVRLAARADATYVGRPLLTADGTVPINLALKGVTGSRLPDAPASIDVRGDSIPLELASRFTDAISQIQGFAKGTAAIRGPIKSPEVTGNVALNLGQARVNALGILVRDVNGNIRMQGDTVLIDSLTANSGGGRMEISGGLGIATISAPSFNLRFTADNARVLDNEQGRVKADANIALVGPFNAANVIGRARVREGVVYIPKSDDKEVINAGDPSVFAVIDTTDIETRELVPGQSPLLDNLRMNLRLAVDRDVWVRSKEANVEVYTDGDLRVNVDRRRQTLTLDGAVNTDRGTYEFLSKRFQIKRGTATFVGSQEINPLLQLTGEYEVKQAGRQAMFIRVLIGGTVQSPRLTLESDAQPPISQSDLLSYLAFGSETGELLQFGGSSVSGGTAGGGLVGTTAALATRQLTGVALGVLVDEVEGQTARALGADVFNITTADVPTEFASGNFSGGLGYLRATQVEYGRYFTTRRFVALQIGAAPGFRVEQQLSRLPGVSVEGTMTPRFFLPEPSLSQQNLRKANSLGLFLVRRWRF